MSKFEVSTAFKSLVRTWPSTLLSLAVLAICSAGFFHIAFFATREYSYERWLPDYDRIYRVWLELEEPGESMKIAVTPALLAPTLATTSSQVASSATLLRYPRRPVLVEVGDVHFFEDDNFFTTDQGFFEVFGIPLVRGDTSTALTSSESVVITDRAARKYFGTLDCIGQTMLLNKDDLKVVTGVVSSRQGPTHLVYDFLTRQPPDPGADWYQFNARTYVRLAPGADVQRLEDRLREMEQEKYGVDAADYRYHIQPIRDIHLRSNLLGEFPGGGSAVTVRTAILAALIFLALGATNFAVFEAVRQSTRAKETVIRVINGASSRQIFGRAVAESTILAGAGVTLGLLLWAAGGTGWLGLPEPEVRLLASSESWWILLSFLLVVAAVALVASLYPAAVALKVDLAGVTKGTWRKPARRLSVRRLLVGIQLLIAFTLAFASFRVSSQAHHLGQRTLGFPTADLIEVELPRSTSASAVNLRDRIARHPSIAGASLVSQAPGGALRKVSFVPQGSGGEHIMSGVVRGDEHLPSVMGLTRIAGESFGVDSRANRSSAFLVNEKAAEVFGWTDAVGKRLTLDADDEPLEGQVVGVVADFQFASVVEPIDPVVIMYQPDQAQTILVRTQPGTDQPKAVIETLWGQAVPGEPLRANSITAKIASTNEPVRRLARAGRLIAGSASGVAALGLLALIGVLLTSRAREIAIRRLCGASQSRLTATLTVNLAAMILIAGVAAVPLGSYIAQRMKETPVPEATVPIAGYLLVIVLFEAVLLAATLLYLRRDKKRSITATLSV